MTSVAQLSSDITYPAEKKTLNPLIYWCLRSTVEPDSIIVIHLETTETSLNQYKIGSSADYKKPSVISELHPLVIRKVVLPNTQY